jgi:hypothetical protein
VELQKAPLTTAVRVVAAVLHLAAEHSLQHQAQADQVG